MDDTTTILDRPIADLRRARGLTQEALARLSGLSLATISMIERGQRGTLLTGRVASRICKALSNPNPRSNTP